MVRMFLILALIFIAVDVMAAKNITKITGPKAEEFFKTLEHEGHWHAYLDSQYAEDKGTVCIAENLIHPLSYTCFISQDGVTPPQYIDGANADGSCPPAYGSDGAQCLHD